MTAPDQKLQPTLRGSSQSGVRQHNERLVLSLIRAHGQLPKAEIARLSGLSPQTVSVIVRQLERDSLLSREQAQKGKVGQPLQPFSLNPDGALAIGLKVGRRSGELVLIGLDGKVRNSLRHTYSFPTPQGFVAFARDGIDTLLSGLSPELRTRISGMGIAMPFDIWKWEEEAGAAPEVMEAWQHFDLTAELAALFPWPVASCNDATAACAAELLLGSNRALRDFAYFYVGYFVGGGLVLNGHLHVGPTGNAGAFGSIPITRGPITRGPAKPEQLIRSASLYKLERALREAGQDPSLLWRMETDWSAAEAQLKPWLSRAAQGLAQACAAIAAIVDCPTIIIDGALPPAVRAALVAAVQGEVQALNTDGISPFEIVEGSIGIDARAMGAASLPLFANFMVDRDILFKSQ